MLSPAPVLVRISHTIDRRSIRVGCCRCSASFDPSNPTTYSVRNLQSSSHRTIIPIAQYTFAFTIPQCYDQPYTLHSEYCVYFIVQIQYNVVFVVVVLVDDDAVLSLSLSLCVCVCASFAATSSRRCGIGSSSSRLTDQCQPLRMLFVANLLDCFEVFALFNSIQLSVFITLVLVQCHTHTHTHTHTHIHSCNLECECSSCVRGEVVHPNQYTISS
jgi:hypothetical protein